jgi:hypothetical protein
MRNGGPVKTLPRTIQRRSEVDVADFTLVVEAVEPVARMHDRRPRRAVIIELLDGPGAGWRTDLANAGVVRLPTQIVASRRVGGSVERIGTYALERLEGDVGSYRWMPRRLPRSEEVADPA